MTGKCPECIEKQKTMPGYCCALCALKVSLHDDNVIKDPTTGTVHIDLSDPNHPFWNPGHFGSARKV